MNEKDKQEIRKRLEELQEMRSRAWMNDLSREDLREWDEEIAWYKKILYGDMLKPVSDGSSESKDTR